MIGAVIFHTFFKVVSKCSLKLKFKPVFCNSSAAKLQAFDNSVTFVRCYQHRGLLHNLHSLKPLLLQFLRLTFFKPKWPHWAHSEGFRRTRDPGVFGTQGCVVFLRFRKKNESSGFRLSTFKSASVPQGCSECQGDIQSTHSFQL